MTDPIDSQQALIKELEERSRDTYRILYIEEAVVDWAVRQGTLTDVRDCAARAADTKVLVDHYSKEIAAARARLRELLSGMPAVQMSDED